MDIDYTDGDEIEARILELIRQSPQRHSSQATASHLYGESWPVRYHLCPERANLLRPFDFSGLDVLELGAGMGAVSRYLAENARSLHVVEGTQSRFSVLTERLRGLTNWTGQVGNFETFETHKTFDAVCVVGVLEYSELFLKDVGPNPHLWLLKRCRSLLKPGGVLFLAIENALGLKYWNGCAEDHRSTLFDGIVGYPDKPTARTFSRKELQGLLTQAGFGQVDGFYPFPDYKVPTTVLSDGLLERAPKLAAELAVTEPYVDYLGHAPIKYFSDTLASDHLSRAGLLAEFSNSFLFVASTESASPTRRRVLSRYLGENELAWHYAHGRREPTQTVFFQDRRSDSLLVAKTGLYSTAREQVFDAVGIGELHWSALGPEPISHGLSVRTLLARHAYFGEWKPFLALMESFLRWVIRQWATSQTAHLDGRVLDGIFANARLVDGAAYDGVNAPREFVLFDQEWSLKGSFPASWFIFRNVYNLSREQALLANTAPFRSLRALYELLCVKLGVVPDFKADLAREARLQAVTSRGTLEGYQADLRNLMDRPFPAPRMPRIPKQEAALRPRWRKLFWDIQTWKWALRKIYGAVRRRVRALLPAPT